MINYKLLKIDSYWIIVNNKEPEDRKFCVSYHKSDKSPILDFYYQGDPYVYPVSSIIASNHPKTNNWFPSITFSDEVAKELGIVDIKQLGIDRTIERKWNPNSTETRRVANEIILATEYGYNQALSDNKDKQFTLEQLRQAIILAQMNITDLKGKDFGDNIESVCTNIVQSLTKQEYEVELEMEIIEGCNCTIQGYKVEGSSCSERNRCLQPKIINNSVKVIKLIK